MLTICSYVVMSFLVGFISSLVFVWPILGWREIKRTATSAAEIRCS